MRKGVRIEAAPVRAEAILESAETAELRIRFQRRAAKRTISLTSSSDDQSGSSERRRKGSLTGAARLVLARSRPIEWRRSRRTPTRRSSLQRAECGACARSTCPPLPPKPKWGPRPSSFPLRSSRTSLRATPLRRADDSTAAAAAGSQQFWVAY